MRVGKELAAEWAEARAGLRGGEDGDGEGVGCADKFLSGGYSGKEVSVRVFQGGLRVKMWEGGQTL